MPSPEQTVLAGQNRSLVKQYQDSTDIVGCWIYCNSNHTKKQNRNLQKEVCVLWTAVAFGGLDLYKANGRLDMDLYL